MNKMFQVLLNLDSYFSIEDSFFTICPTYQYAHRCIEVFQSKGERGKRGNHEL